MKPAPLLIILLPLIGCTTSPNNAAAPDSAGIDAAARRLMKWEYNLGNQTAVSIPQDDAASRSAPRGGLLSSRNEL